MCYEHAARPTKGQLTLRRIWEAAGYPWSLRLQALLPTWLPWACRRWRIPREVVEKPRTVSGLLGSGEVRLYRDQALPWIRTSV